ncbi:MAG TPA: hypothetical protein VNX68_16515 [Nitrosopumilaceae archaeon]|jgi:hypothetical protein|nr:hypothetical protein [Nitrosopumilaceae archaeon]
MPKKYSQNRNKKGQFKKGIIPPTAFKDGHKPWNTGKKRPEMTGEKNWKWKGDKVGYEAVHSWLHRQLGKAQRCENSKCVYPRLNERGRLMVKPWGYHWSNKSGKYLRDISDWWQLCISCHKFYDMKRKKQNK